MDGGWKGDEKVIKEKGIGCGEGGWWVIGVVEEMREKGKRRRKMIFIIVKKNCLEEFW